MNKVILFGKLTRDPELKSLPGGQAVCSFSLATNRSYKDKEGKKQEQSEFHNVVAFGKQADVINLYCKKGFSLLIEGRLQTRSWEKDGVKHYKTETVLESFTFGARPKETNSETQETAQEDEINPEDIPF